jgi:hypothetical protein
VPMPLYRRFKSYVGLNTTDKKLRRLLKNYRFNTCRSVLQENLQSGRERAVSLKERQ